MDARYIGEGIATVGIWAAIAAMVIGSPVAADGAPILVFFGFAAMLPIWSK